MSGVPSPSTSSLLDASFSSAASFASSFGSSLDKATQQSIYGLYKCSTVGCPPPNRPSVFDVGRAKWDGWSSKYNCFKGDKDAAKRAYINLIVKVSEGTFKPTNYDDLTPLDHDDQDKGEKTQPSEERCDEPRRLNLSQTSPERYWLLSTLEVR